MLPKLTGLNDAFRVLQDILDNTRPVLVYFDPDVDGMISGWLLCQWLNKNGISFSTYVNPNRKHGFLLPYESVKGLTILSGDFTVTHEIMKNLVENYGVTYLSLDHHDNPEEQTVFEGKSGNLGVMVNNQYPGNPDWNKFQSGAGVVWQVLASFDSSFDNKLYRGMVGWTLLSDSRDISSDEARSFLTDLFSLDKKSPYIGKLISSVLAGRKDYEFGVPRMDRYFVDFQMTPAINSMLRFGKEREAVKFILSGVYPEIDYHKRQKGLVKGILKHAKIREFGDSFCSVTVRMKDFPPDTQEILGNFIGLVCSRFSDTHNVVGRVIDSEGVIVRSSFRGRSSGAPYKDYIIKATGLDCRGHQEAFGIKDERISEEQLEKAGIACESAEESVNEVTPNIIEVNNFGSWVKKHGHEVAEENGYCMSSQRTYIRLGESVKMYLVTRTNKFALYNIDGYEVKYFGDDPENPGDLIDTYLTRGNIKFVFATDL